MIEEIKYPYSNLTEIEKERIDNFRSYHMASNNDIHVYYVTDLCLGAGYNIIVSLHIFNNANEIVNDDITKDITDIDNLIDTF